MLCLLYSICYREKLEINSANLVRLFIGAHNSNNPFAAILNDIDNLVVGDFVNANGYPGKKAFIRRIPIYSPQSHARHFFMHGTNCSRKSLLGTDDRLIYEASDLIYHLIVLLTSKGHRIEELAAELVKRHKE